MTAVNPEASATRRPDDHVPSDHSLLRRFRRGSQDAATELYLRYAHRIRALVRAHCSPALAQRLDADDIVQSVFRRFFCRVSQGDYDVPPGEELWGLFLVIALNKIRAEEAYHRAGKRDVRVTVEEPPEDIPGPHGNDEEAFAVLQMTIDDRWDGCPSCSAPWSRWHPGARGRRHRDRDGAIQRTVERSLQDIRSKLRAA
jgi:RNA polymerase sigma-70 factor (ECF subfamily)